MPLEDPNDPNVLMRWERMREALRYMQVLHGCALQVSLAQNMPIPTAGGIGMASEYVPTQSRDVVTVAAFYEALVAHGLTPPDMPHSDLI